MRGEKIYEYDLDVTGVTDYGISLDAERNAQHGRRRIRLGQHPPGVGRWNRGPGRRQDSHHRVHAVSFGVVLRSFR
jgi:hypothetical protein